VRADDVVSVVLDTNVWLDWLVFDDPRVRAVRDASRGGRLRIMACVEARAELADVLARPRLLAQGLASRARRDMVQFDASQLLDEFDAAVTLGPRAPACGLDCRDPDDQRFIDLAVAQSARYLLTRDRALLALARSARKRFDLVIAQPERAAASDERPPLWTHPL
jgi:putative PIN family toxin of toxin-antitoxin system